MLLHSNKLNRPPEKIGIFRALKLGDLLCTVPAFRSLRKAFPESRISLIGLPSARRIYERYPQYLDNFIEFPGFPGLKEMVPQLKKFPQFLDQVQKEKFDLALQMHGAGPISNFIVEAFGARQCAGFYNPDQDSLDPDLFLPYQQKKHEIRRHLELLEFLGIATSGEDLEFRVRADDEKYLQQFEALKPLLTSPMNYVCIHPGASSPEKRWPLDYFIRISEHLSFLGYKVVVTGSSFESGLIKEMILKARCPLVDSSVYDLPLGPLAALLQKSRLLISNDTGVSHLAAALKTPSVIIFSTADPIQWAPLDNQLHHSLQSQTEVDTEEVIVHINQLLKTKPSSISLRKPLETIVDVLIPTFERPAALAVTLTSLCYQEKIPFRLIISDQSEDIRSLESPEVQTPLRLLAAQGRQIEIHNHRPRKGISEHRQYLLNLAQAPYCLFLDDDILLEANVIERMVHALQEEKCGFVGCAPIGLSYLSDFRPQEQNIEFWNGPVEPEMVQPSSEKWQRYKLHNAANIYHLQQRLRISAKQPVRYKVAWIGACVLYDRRKLTAVGGYSFWNKLPKDHCGEDVLVQMKLMAKYGGCGLLPSGAYHQELPTTIHNRAINLPEWVKDYKV